jgi:hypothetical protein
MVSADDVDGTSRMLRGFLSRRVDATEQMGKAARTCFLARFEAGIAADAICAVFDESEGPGRLIVEAFWLDDACRGNPRKSSGSPAEVSDLQTDSERYGVQRSRAQRYTIQAIAHSDHHDTNHNDGHQTEDLEARAEHRAANDTENHHHAPNSQTNVGINDSRKLTSHPDGTHDSPS